MIKRILIILLILFFNIQSKAEENLLISEALNIMNTKKITSLFVCKKNKPIGIVHIHDLLRLTS